MTEISKRSSRRPRKIGCRTFPSADFARYSISASSFGSTQMPLCATRFLKACVFRTNGFQALPQVGGRDLVEAVVDLARVDEIAALAPADEEPVPLAPVQREAGDGQGLPLRAGLLHPVVASPGRIGAVPDLRHDAFQPDFACVREHFLAVDPEAFAELDVGPGDDLLQFGLPLEQRHLPDIAAVQIEQIEGDQNDAGRLTLELVLQDREVGGAIGGRHHDLAVDDGGACLDVPGVMGDLLEPMRPVVTAPGEYLHRLVGEVDLDPVAVELDFVDPARSGRHPLDRGRQGRLDEAGQRRLDADFGRFPTLERHDKLHATSDSNWHGSVCSGTRKSLLRCLGTHRTGETDGGS